GCKRDLALHREQSREQGRRRPLLAPHDLEQNVFAHPKSAIRRSLALQYRHASVVDDEPPAADAGDVEKVARLDPEGSRRLDQLPEVLEELAGVCDGRRWILGSNDPP